MRLSARALSVEMCTGNLCSTDKSGVEREIGLPQGWQTTIVAFLLGSISSSVCSKQLEIPGNLSRNHPALGLGRNTQPGNAAFGMLAFSGDARLHGEP